MWNSKETKRKSQGLRVQLMKMECCRVMLANHKMRWLGQWDCLITAFSSFGLVVGA